MRVAVYGGSFNPLHVGHLAVLRYLSQGTDFDWTYLVVSPQNPIKDTVSADSAAARYAAALAAVERHPGLKVTVDDIELRMPPPNYTIRTLDALKRREPDNDFTLVVGADNLVGIHRWRDFPRILIDYGVAVYPRAGSNVDETRHLLLEECRMGEQGFENVMEHLYRIEVLDAPAVDISSTEIRAGMEAGRDMSAWLM